MSPTIETTNLHKRFGDKVAVEDLTLTVDRGEVFGFLGPNGAGKTTSIKMLLGLVLPTSGDGKLLGKPIGDPSTRTKVGFLPEHFRFHEWLTANELLHLHADLYDMPRADAKTRVPELLELVGLQAHGNKRIQTFSKGMQQRVGLAQSLLNRPELVILDEPTSGLDPVGRRLVRDIILRVRNEGTTVFLNSHLLSEIEITCERVAFIRQGRLVHISRMSDLGAGLMTLSIRAGNLTPTAFAGLAQWGKDITQDSDRIAMTIESDVSLPSIARYLVEQGADLYDLHPHRPSLEELFIQIVGTESTS